VLRAGWRERGGPRVAAPGVAGFGSRMLAATVERQLGGRFAAEWLPAGMTCRINLPVALLLTGAPNPALREET
jgi:two-component sensor histidine kinase